MLSLFLSPRRHHYSILLALASCCCGPHLLLHVSSLLNQFNNPTALPYKYSRIHHFLGYITSILLPTFSPFFSFSPLFWVLEHQNQYQYLGRVSPQPQPQHHQSVGLLAARMMNTAVFSELTCNASGSRKRAGENQMETQQLYHHHYHRQPQQSKVDNFKFYQLGNESSPSSTSGRTEQLGSYPFNNRDLELEALIRFQNEKVRLMVEETRKKQSRCVLGMIEQESMKRLVEKETEVERAKRTNMELEEKVKQMSAENQMWFSVAKNSEATISSLRVSLEQILLRNAGNQVVAAEGFGETDGGEGEAEVRRCKGCGGEGAWVMVLPCRHLCLCTDCEDRVHTCPLCNSLKNSTLQVFIS